MSVAAREARLMEFSAFMTECFSARLISLTPVISLSSAITGEGSACPPSGVMADQPK